MIIKEVGSILENIKSADGKLEKEKIITDNKSNKLFLMILDHLYNPYIKTNIAKRKLSKAIVQKFDCELKSIESYLSYLGRSTGTDENIATVQKFINDNDEDVKWLLESLATKDLKVGITSKTINKAMGYEFIPKFDLMLSDKWIDVKTIKGEKKVVNNWEKMINKQVIATTKLDGIRAVAFVTDDGVKMYSRSGNILEGFTTLENEFKELPNGVYDGEILAINFDNLDSKELFQLTSSITRKKGEKKYVEFWAFDYIDAEDFKKGLSLTSSASRKDLLSRIISTYKNGMKISNIHYLKPLYEGLFDKDKIDELSNNAKDNGEEGIMVQLSDAPYECKRTKNILKVKTFESCDIKCVDMYEGKTGKNVGKLGGLILDYKGYNINVGGGFTDSQRELYWNNPNLVLNKIIEISYFEEFEDEDGRLDLRFAQFKGVREDKDSPSYF